MLVLITYDVNTETDAGKKTAAPGGKAVCELWKKSSKFRV